MDNSQVPQPPQTPQEPQTPPVTPQAPQAPQSPQTTQAVPMPAPQAPVDTAKSIRLGWTLFVVSIVVTIVGLFFGVALAASAIIAALAGRLGLQAKNKPLAITALIFCGISLLLFGLALITN